MLLLNPRPGITPTQAGTLQLVQALAGADICIMMWAGRCRGRGQQQPAEAAAQKPLLLVAAAVVPCHSRDQAVARPAPPSESSAPSPDIIIYSYHSLVSSDDWISISTIYGYLLADL